MKRFLLLITVTIVSVLFTSCTDNSLQEIENRHDKSKEKLQFIDKHEAGPGQDVGDNSES